jgi:protein-disulfide isomerase
LKQVEETYGAKVRIVFKQQPLPFHPNAMPAALAAEAAHEQGKFWEMEDKLFSNQQALSPESYKKWAEEIGLDMAKFNAAFDKQKFKARIEEDMAMATAVTATGTPAFFINGRKVGGAQPFENFKKIIDQELEKAEGMVKGGVKPEELYAKIIEGGKTQEPEPAVGKDEYKFDYEGSPTTGDKKAPIVIATFEDFQ